LAAAPSENCRKIGEKPGKCRGKARRKKFNLTNILMYQVQSEPKIYDLLTEQAEQEHQDWDVMSAESREEQVHPGLMGSFAAQSWFLEVCQRKKRRRLGCIFAGCLKSSDSFRGFK